MSFLSFFLLDLIKGYVNFEWVDLQIGLLALKFLIVISITTHSIDLLIF